MNCPLCENTGKPFFKDEYFICGNCKGIYKNKNYYLNTENEINRYKEHNNDINDPKYQKFVSPVTNRVLENFTPEDKGLDYGAGTGPVITKVLTDNSYNIKPYDPFFIKNDALLDDKYDYIVCCEVIEHFNNPKKDFSILYNMLKPNGELICMTHIYNSTIQFPNWYYKNDPTHVFIYQAETIEFLSAFFGFGSFDINDRMIILKNKCSQDREIL